VTSNKSLLLSAALVSPEDFFKYHTVKQGYEVLQFVEALRYIRKVADSIPDSVIGIFHSHNPSGRTVALDTNLPLTEMSTRNISWG
jgi:hypothetical protein